MLHLPHYITASSHTFWYLLHFVIPVTLCHNFAARSNICHNLQCLSHFAISTEWTGTQDSGHGNWGNQDIGHYMQNPGPETQIPESKIQYVDRRLRTKISDPGPQICDPDVGFLLYMILGLCKYSLQTNIDIKYSKLTYSFNSIFLYTNSQSKWCNNYINTKINCFVEKFTFNKKTKGHHRYDYKYGIGEIL